MSLFAFPADMQPPAPVVVGFHGTSAAAAHAIVEQQRMLPSRNDSDWLGDGVYFWQDYPFRAWEWAKDHFPNQDLGVVRANITLGKCLDMQSGYFDELLARAFDAFERRCQCLGAPVPVNRGKNFGRDRAAMNLLCENMDCTVDTVRAVYLEGREPFRGSGHRRHSHTQLCVRNCAMIGEIQLVGTLAIPTRASVEGTER